MFDMLVSNLGNLRFFSVSNVEFRRFLCVKLFGVFCVKPKKPLVIFIEKFEFSVNNVVKCYDSVLNEVSTVPVGGNFFEDDSQK